MRCTILMLFAGLSGCGGAGPHFRGVDPVRVTVEGSMFDVRVQPRLAEAVRVNPQYAPRLGPIADRAKMAMEQVSGCEVTEVRGDAAQVTGLLDCGTGGPPRWVPGRAWECFAVDGYVSPGLGEAFLDYECEQVL